MLPVQNFKFEKGLLPFAPLRSKVLDAMLVALFRAFYGGRRSLQFFSIFSKIKIDLNKKNSPRLLTHHRVSVSKK